MRIAHLRTVRLGIKSLMLHKLRSVLTILGIVFGVCSVIAMLAIGEGAAYKAQEQIKQLGATNVIVRSVKPPQDSTSPISGGSFFLEYGLLRDDYKRINETIPTIQQAERMREIRREMRYNHRQFDGRLVGCTPAYRDINQLKVVRGRFISDLHLETMANVCVIAEETAKALFPYEDPIGKSLRIDNAYYVIVGQTQYRTPTAAIGGSLDSQDFNRDAYIPITTLQVRIGDRVYTRRAGSREGEIVQLSQITVTVDSADNVVETAKAIEDMLRAFHDQKDYAIIVPLELLRQAEQLRWIFNMVLGSIAAISLLVGGIGIMNIMLATVTERTREIGIRRALGAKQRDITQQFLVETVVLSGTGGLLGVALGLLTGPAFRTLRAAIEAALPQVAEHLRDAEPRLALWSLPVAFGISVGIGVLFGLYPARRAAKMDPIEALRHE